MQGGGGRSMAQRMNKEDAETRRADGKPGEDESKCCRASEEISTFAINHGEKLGSRRQIGRNVGRCVHHMRRNAGRIEPYLVRGAEGRPLKGRIPTTYCRNSQRAVHLRQGQTQLRNILTQPLQPESVAMQAPKIVTLREFSTAQNTLISNVDTDHCFQICYQTRRKPYDRPGAPEITGL